MDTLLIAVLIYFGFCIKVALTVVALSMFYGFRLPFSKGRREMKGRRVRRVESVITDETLDNDEIQISTDREIRTPPGASAGKPADRGLTGKEMPSKVQATARPVASSVAQPIERTSQKTGRADNAMPSRTEAANKKVAASVSERVQKPLQETVAGGTGDGDRKMMKVVTGPPRKKGEKIEVVDVRKQVQPKDSAAVGGAEPRKTGQDDAARRVAPSPESMPQPVVKETKAREEAPQEVPPGEATRVGGIGMSGGGEPEEIIKGDEAATDIEPIEDKEAEPEATEEASEAEESEQETAPKEQSGLGDLADLFATSASDFTEKSKLAEQVQEVDVNDILQEGLGLLGKAKKPEE